MTSNHEKLPSLTAVRAFEAAARLGSFTLAAQELHVTQSAVSRQVQLLEAEISTPLFIRRGRAISLTADGRALAEVAAQSFDALRSVAARIRLRAGMRSGPGNTVTVSMLPSLAAKWFTPRLSRLLAAMPDLDLRIHASRDVIDLERDGIDCAIRYGRGDWTGVDVTLLMKEAVFPVASPKLGIGAVENLKDAVLLQSDNPEGWASWLATAGIAPSMRRRLAAKGPFFSDDVSLIEAAVNGLGVALVRSRLVERELQNGMLVRIGHEAIDASYAYYIATPDGAVVSPQLAQLRNWLLAEAARESRLPETGG